MYVMVWYCLSHLCLASPHGRRVTGNVKSLLPDDDEDEEGEEDDDDKHVK